MGEEEDEETEEEEEKDEAEGELRKVLANPHAITSIHQLPSISLRLSANSLRHT